MQIVSWNELIIGLFVAGVLWYGYVLLKYYPELLKRKKLNAAPVKWVREKEIVPGAKVDQHALVHELMEELKLIFAAGIRDQLHKEQLLDAVRARLIKYSGLSDNIKLSVNQHIVNEFSLQLKINVEADDINSLWK